MQKRNNTKKEEQNLMLRHLPLNLKTKEKKSNMHLSHTKKKVMCIKHDLFLNGVEGNAQLVHMTACTSDGK